MDYRMENNMTMFNIVRKCPTKLSKICRANAAVTPSREAFSAIDRFGNVYKCMHISSLST